MSKIFGLVVIIVAVLMAVLVSVMPVSRLHDVILLTRFFEAMLPILGVGALVKYILSLK